MDSNIKLLDVVALSTDRPDCGLVRGQVGTVVEILPDEAFEVEFSDNSGRCYAEVALPESDLIVLHHQPVTAG